MHVGSKLRGKISSSVVCVCVCVCVCVGVIATGAVDERQDIILTPSYGGVMPVVYIHAVFLCDLPQLLW